MAEITPRQPAMAVRRSELRVGNDGLNFLHPLISGSLADVALPIFWIIAERSGRDCSDFNECGMEPGPKPSVADHRYGRNQNRVVQRWLICSAVNRRLNEMDFKAAALSASAGVATVHGGTPHGHSARSVEPCRNSRASCLCDT